jgi:hypothetical protein
LSARYLKNDRNYRFEIKNGDFYQRGQEHDKFWLTLLNFFKVKFYVLRVYISDTNKFWNVAQMVDTLLAMYNGCFH